MFWMVNKAKRMRVRVAHEAQAVGLGPGWEREDGTPPPAVESPAPPPKKRGRPPKVRH